MPYNQFPALRKTAKRHIVWRKITTYTAIYRRGRTKITVKSLAEPPRLKTLRTSKGPLPFKLVSFKPTTREVIIVARTKNRKKPVEEEIEELEALEELEELDDEDEEEIEDVEEVEDDEDEPDDEDDEDEDEDAPPPKRSSKKSKTASSSSSAKKSRTKPAQSRASANGKVGTQEVAEHFGVDGRTLRMVLRKHEVAKDPDSGRYEWSSLTNREVVRIGKLIKGGAAKEVKTEQLDKIKNRKSTKTAATTTKKKRAK